MLSSIFSRPLLIYDDRCYSCSKFAMAARDLSRGWIRIAGHYNSKEAAEAKIKIFPQGYDSTRMFWLVNKAGAHGGRSGLLPVAQEIIAGWFKDGSYENNHVAACEVGDMSCYTPANTMKRIAGTLKKGACFHFD